jgi:hypothetical protein
MLSTRFPLPLTLGVILVALAEAAMSSGPAVRQTRDLRALPALPPEPRRIEVLEPELLSAEASSATEALRSEAASLEPRRRAVKAESERLEDRVSEEHRRLAAALTDADRARQEMRGGGIFGHTARAEASGRAEASIREAEKAQSAIVEANAKLSTLRSDAETIDARLEQIPAQIDEIVDADRAALSPSVRRYIEPFMGVPVAEGRLIVAFAPGAAVAAIEGVFDTHRLTPISRLPTTNVFLVETDGLEAATRPDAERLADLLARLEAEPSAELVTFDSYLGSAQAAAPSPLASDCQMDLDADWDWTQAQSPACAKALIAMRFPAAWALVRRLAPPGATPGVGVFDTGFDDHPDLEFKRSSQCIIGTGSHGTGVLSVLSAKWDKHGFDGALGAASVQVCSPPVLKFQSSIDAALRVASTGFAAASCLVSFILNEKLQVVNYSMAYNWHDYLKKLDSNAVDLQVANHVQLLSYAAPVLRSAVIVAAAGNDRARWKGFPARFGSPVTAFHLDDTSTNGNIIVVGSLAPDGSVSKLSNDGADVFAFGEDIPTYDGTGRSLRAGTSFAAPYVTAAAAMAAQINPDLKPIEVAAVVRSATTERGAVDAFETVLVALGSNAPRRLADLDGNGKVDADDEAILKTAAAGPGASGSPADVNGDGRASLDRNAKARVLGVLRSDPEVIEAAWTGSGGPTWSP